MSIRGHVGVVAVVLIALMSLSGCGEVKATKQKRKFGQFYDQLRRNYVDELDQEAIVESAIRAVLGELDPHSRYMTAKEVEQQRAFRSGRYSGVGISTLMVSDTLRVITVKENAPAHKVGVMVGDRIVGMDGQSVTGLPHKDIIERFSGKKGESISLKIKRFGTDSLFSIDVQRDVIVYNPIVKPYEILPGVGYIAIQIFSNHMFDRFLEAKAGLGDIETLIIDLRENGGGIMNEAIDIMSHFIAPKQIMFVERGHGIGEKVHRSKRRFLKTARDLDTKLILLVDEQSASASELFAGMIQDLDRGVVVGRRTFGKGLVQNVARLNDGSMVAITRSRYHTPSGRVIQRAYTKGHKKEYYDEFEERINSFDADTIARNDSLRYKSLNLGKTLYGGGGIYPDFYIEKDSTTWSNSYETLLRKGIITEYAMAIYDWNSEKIKEIYSGAEEYIEDHVKGDYSIANIHEFAKHRGVDVDLGELERAENRIVRSIQLQLVNMLWGREAMYKLRNTDDAFIKKAVEIALDWDAATEDIVVKSK